jgi:hypothetical protein
MAEKVRRPSLTVGSLRVTLTSEQDTVTEVEDDVLSDSGSEEVVSISGLRMIELSSTSVAGLLARPIRIPSINYTAKHHGKQPEGKPSFHTTSL